MKLWLVRCSSGLTAEYHSGGAMLIGAENIEMAVEIFHRERVKCEPDACDPQIEEVIPQRGVLGVFANTGCC